MTVRVNVQACFTQSHLLFLFLQKKNQNKNATADFYLYNSSWIFVVVADVPNIWRKKNETFRLIGVYVVYSSIFTGNLNHLTLNKWGEN